MITTDLAGEAIRLHHRYLVEIVEELGLCPWARRCRIEGRLRAHATGETEPEAAALAATEFLAELGRDADVEVAFLIFPCLEIGRREFASVGARVNELQAARHPPGAIPFMLAAFHPDAPVDTNSPERFIPYLRRTPDPCLQIVRATALDSVRDKTPQGTQLVDPLTFDFTKLREEVPLRERIARTNLETASRLGIDELARRLADIRADRDRTYAVLRSSRE
jgi:hypothetical protein